VSLVSRALESADAQAPGPERMRGIARKKCLQGEATSDPAACCRACAELTWVQNASMQRVLATLSTFRVSTWRRVAAWLFCSVTPLPVYSLGAQIADVHRVQAAFRGSCRFFHFPLFHGFVRSCLTPAFLSVKQFYASLRQRLAFNIRGDLLRSGHVALIPKHRLFHHRRLRSQGRPGNRFNVAVIIAFTAAVRHDLPPAWRW
jgi:hypothetical protein